MYLRLALLLSILLLSAAALCERADEFAARRDAMVDALQNDGRALEPGHSAFDPRVMAALREVPRHRFVPSWLAERAYENRPLPIGHGQTISQPYIVALMTDLLALNPDDVVLEVGTGSGYQAAVLAELVAQVYTIEIVAPLAEEAATRLEELGYDNIETHVGDGYGGWPQHAPFDAIMVTAGAEHIPQPLIDQLKPGGRMIIPVGGSARTQHLLLVEKDAEGEVETRRILPVRFVPLTGDR